MQLAPRLGCAVQPVCRGIGGSSQPGRGGGAEQRPIGTELHRQRLEEGDAGAGRQLAVARQDLARERDARSFAASRKQVLAKFDETFRTRRCVAAPVARQKRAAAL